MQVQVEHVDGTLENETQDPGLKGLCPYFSSRGRGFRIKIFRKICGSLFRKLNDTVGSKTSSTESLFITIEELYPKNIDSKSSPAYF